MKKPFKIDLASYGREGEWVEVLDPRHLTPRETKAINALNDGEKIFRAIATAWHVKDDNGIDLVDPQTDSYEDIPNGLFATVVEDFRSLAGQSLPKA